MPSLLFEFPEVFDLLCALPAYPQCVQRWSQIPATEFVEHRPGYFTTAQPYQFKEQSQTLYYQYVQRSGLRAEDCHYQSFLATAKLAQVPALTKDYPQRWHVEEFFKFNQALARGQSRNPLALQFQTGFPLPMIDTAARRALKRQIISSS